MLRDLVNPKLVKEAELERPASSWPERLFRFSLFFFVATGAAMKIPSLIWTKDQIQDYLGRSADVLALVFIGSFLYMLNYFAYRFVKSRLIRWTWFSLMALVGLCIILTYFAR